MTAIPWRDDFNTGIMSIDLDHDTLIQAINALCERSGPELAGDAVLRHLGEIHALIGAHFAEEEKTMMDMAFSGYREHKQDHDQLLNDILEIMDRVNSENAIDHISMLGKMASNWFSDHFSTLDKALHLQTHGAGNYGL